MSDPSSPKSNVPTTRLDRSALERVLARAAELQIGPNDPGEEFTEEQLIELGKEVGLPAQHLRQALAEERTRSIVPEDQGGIATSVFGPSRARAGRTVSGRSADVLQAIDAWMQREELLIVKRHHAERIVWEPRQDFFVGVKRALKMGGRDYALSHAFEVSATVISVDDSRVHVGLDADFSPGRSRAMMQTVGTTVFGGLAGAALFAMGFPVLLVAAPVVLLPAMGFGASRTFQTRIITRAQLSLEQLLDRLERGEIGRRSPDSLLGAIVAAASSLPPRRL
jgi:hypothetical protein